MNYSLNWDLDSIFPGGSTSQEFQDKLHDVKTMMDTYQALLSSWQAPTQNPLNFLQNFASILQLKQDLQDSFTQCFSYVTALHSQNTMDSAAITLLNQIQKLHANFKNDDIRFSKLLLSFSPAEWQSIHVTPFFRELTFTLNELRDRATDLLTETEENLINQLSIDGFYGWSQHYETLVSTLKIPFKHKEPKYDLSIGQAYNRMMASADNATRKQLFILWEETWQKKASAFADILNHLDGFRIENNRLHGITDYLEVPLKENRMSEQTLQIMWTTISEEKSGISNYLKRKAQLLGKNKLEWQDQEAPLLLRDFPERRLTFDEAASFITHHFETFSPKMAKFAKQAFEQKWIEAEDRPNKQPGGYCEDFPEKKESRIFLTYDGSINEVATIAHELGHAYHSFVMKDFPALNRNYGMSVAETASTFAEFIVTDAALKTAKTKEEKVYLLDLKLQNATAMLCNIHARFLFESEFYKQRKNKILTAEELSQLMLHAQKEAFENQLASYHPHFWASKLHFYIDDLAFYNFPYTFGYLFSIGIYTLAEHQKASFEDDYIALLQDTGKMTVEELAKKHLKADLTQKEFWQKALATIQRDVDMFLSMTETFI